MSALYSIITFGASLAVYLSNPVAPSYAPKSGDSTADEVFGILNAIGGLVFAYGGQVVLLEIQVSAGAYVQVYNLPESEAVECRRWAAVVVAEKDPDQLSSRKASLSAPEAPSTFRLLEATQLPFPGIC